MPLVLESPPADGLTVLKQGLHLVQQHQNISPLGGAGRMAVPPAPVVMEPHPVYNLGLDALVAEQGIDSATLVSWRYLIVEGETVAKAAEINVSAVGTSKFNSINAGPAVAGTTAALTVAEHLPQIQQQSYDIRFLRIPALSVQALWLHGQGRDDDKFLLMQPLTQVDDSGTLVARFDAQKPYTTAQLLPALTMLAKTKARLESYIKMP